MLSALVLPVALLLPPGGSLGQSPPQGGVGEEPGGLPGPLSSPRSPGDGAEAPSDRDSLATWSDSLSAPVDPDSIRRPVRSRPTWRSALPPEPAPLSDGVALEDSTIRRSVEDDVRTVLQRDEGLRRIESGSYHLPDPLSAGGFPGREPPVTVIDGLPVNQPGFPEMPADPVGPAWCGAIIMRPADPLVLPSNPTGGPILEMIPIRPESVAVSEARLTRGTSSTFTEEFFLARPTGQGLLRFFYGDSKTEGRSLYGSQFAENLAARYDRGTTWGGIRFGWMDNRSRVRIFDNRRWVWDRSAYDLGARFAVGAWEADFTSAAVWEGSAYEAPEGAAAKRKQALSRNLLRLTGPGDVWRPLASIQFDYQRERFYQPGVLSLDRVHRGLGFAVGVEGESGVWRLRASVGRSAPAEGRAGWVAAVDLGRPIPAGWSLRLHADRSVRPRQLPRLANELGTQVGQSLTVPEVDPTAPLEVIHRVEAGVSRATSRWWLGLGLRAVEIRHAVSGEDGNLVYFSPNGYGFLPRSAYDRTLRLASATLEARRSLPWGFSVEGAASGHVSTPQWDEELWAAPWDARGRLSWVAELFRRDLHVELFLRGTFEGPRGTPQGTLAWSDRYDAGAIGRVESLTLFIILRNLENDLREAGGYDGGWDILPLRSYRTGLTWRFLD